MQKNSIMGYMGIGINGEIIIGTTNGEFLTGNVSEGITKEILEEINQGLIKKVECSVSYMENPEAKRHQDKYIIYKIWVGEKEIYNNPEQNKSPQKLTVDKADDKKENTKNLIIEDVISFAGIDTDGILNLMTTGGEIIEYPGKNAEGMLGQINEAIKNKIDCKIYYSKDGDNHIVHTIQADKKIIYLTRTTLSKEHPKLNLRDRLKVDTTGKTNNLGADPLGTKIAKGFEVIKEQ